MSYCAASDLYDYGLPRGAVPNPGRLAVSANASANTITLDEHGFALNDPVSFRAESGGSLPSPLAEGTTYYAIPATDSTFSVAETEGGAAINLTTAGDLIVVIAPLPIAAAITWGAEIINDMLPAHVVPLEAPYPPIVVMTNAELAAAKLANRGGMASKTLAELVDAARKRLERWAKGIPIRGTNAPAPATLAVTATAPYLDSRGWRRFGGL